MGKKLSTIRSEVREEIDEVLDLEQTEWMSCAQIIPKTKIQTNISNLVNTNFDWETIKLKYTDEQLEKMPDYIKRQKENFELENAQVVLDDVDFNDLNKYQKFTYDLVKIFKEEKKQLCMILLGNLNYII